MKTRKGTAAAAADDGQGQEDDDGREDSRDAGNGEDTIRQGMHAGPRDIIVILFHFLIATTVF